MWQAFTALYLIATLRGQATYWLARVLTEQADRRIGRVDTDAQAEAEAEAEAGHGGIGGRLVAVRRWLEGEAVARGRRAIRRWGLPAVPLCYLTVGFQTLVLAAAGVLRVRWVAFTLAQLPGALAWAAIYTTIGWAAWEALLHLR